MSNGRMKIVGGVGFVVVAGLCIAGGIHNTIIAKDGGAGSAIVQSQGFTVTDSTGQKVAFNSAPNRIVCLDADAYSLIQMLGGENKVVGVSKIMSTSGQMPAGAEVAGTWQDPNVEKILSLKASVVLCYANYTNPKAVKQLEAAGVKVLYINGDQMGTLKSDVTAMGQLLGKEAKAEQFNAMATKYINLVKEKVSKVAADKKVSVYFEEYGKDQTAGKGSAAEQLLEAAGVNNIAANDGQFATVNNSWILAQNPDMIVKVEADGTGVLGDGVTNTDKAKIAYNQLISREGWNDLKAVKNGNVYLMDNNLAFSDLNTIPAMLYIAKWAYPEQFKDVNPAEVQAQINQDFLGKTLSGTYIYNGK